MKTTLLILGASFAIAAVVVGFTGCDRYRRTNPWIETSNYRIQMSGTWYRVELQFSPDGIVRWREGKPDEELTKEKP